MAQVVSGMAAGPLAPIYAEIRERMGLGVVPTAFEAMAAVNGDVLTQNWTAYRYTVLEGLLPRGLKEMIALVVARMAQSGYLVALYGRSLDRLGIPTEVIASLVASGDAVHLPVRDRAVLRFAEGYNGAADDLSLHALERLGFTEEEVAEAADTVLLAGGLCRFANELGLTTADI